MGPPPGVSKIWKSFVTSANPEFDGNQQIRLNLGTLLIVALTWLGVALRYPVYSAGLLVAVLGVAYLAVSFKGRLWSALANLVEHMFRSTRERVGEIRGKHQSEPRPGRDRGKRLNG